MPKSVRKARSKSPVGQLAADQMILDPATVIHEHMREIGAEPAKVSTKRRVKKRNTRKRKGR